ncbi:MAG: DNA-binding protein, partial [Aquihabitans sp.]
TEPHAKHALDDPFAWILVKLDGADTPMLGALKASGMDAVTTGARVKPVWAEEREGHIDDIAHWVLVEGDEA